LVGKSKSRGSWGSQKGDGLLFPQPPPVVLYLPLVPPKPLEIPEGKKAQKRGGVRAWGRVRERGGVRVRGQGPGR